MSDRAGRRARGRFPGLTGYRMPRSTGRPQSPEKQMKFRLLHSRTFLQGCVEQGLSIREIAAKLEVNRTTVRDEMRRWGINPVVRPEPRES